MDSMAERVYLRTRGGDIESKKCIGDRFVVFICFFGKGQSRQQFSIRKDSGLQKW